LKGKETPIDRIERINREFDALLNHRDFPEKTTEQSIPKHLLKFGLTLNEAKSWLKKEPNYKPADESLHEPPNRRRVDRTSKIAI
jgi:hypothetical protein